MLLAGGLVSAQETGFDGFPFLIPFNGLVAGTAPADLARLDAPAGGSGFVEVRDGRFVLSESREPIRFWATNVCFGACFPPHDVAERMARRLGTLGVNCVRFHHMDMAGYPNGIWDQEGAWGDFPHGGFHPESLDRLDYLIAQLKENGVYVNLNLHVSRTFGPADGFPAPGPGEAVPDMGKGVDLFEPRHIEEQKRYARMLLTHVNPYTGNSYAQEPAVAMIEISNEDGLLGQWSSGAVWRLPEPYRDELARQWNAWLRDRYGDTQGLRRVWGEGETQGGDEDLLAGDGVGAHLEVHEPAIATVTETRDEDGAAVHKIVVVKGSPTSWHVQLMWTPLTVQQGTTYQVTLRARASRRVRASVDCRMNHEPWTTLGLSEGFEVGTEWRTHTFSFAATGTEGPDAEGAGGARVTLSSLAEDALTVWVTRPQMTPAAVTALPAGEELESGVSMPRSGQGPMRPPRVYEDFAQFVWDTEAAYWGGMRRFIQEELGARQPVTGTATGFTTPQVMAQTCDFVDSHAYWQHPHFPNRAWDMSDWRIGNRPMVSEVGGGTIGGLAGRRVLGRPFTVTEYDHPAPNEYAAEGLPLVAVYGSQQRWDGVFQFAYGHGADLEKDRFASFFNMQAHPLKLAVLPACSALFRGGLVQPRIPVAAGTLAPERGPAMVRSGGTWGVSAYAGGVEGRAWRTSVVGLSSDGTPALAGGEGHGLEWQTGDGGGRVRFTGQGCAGVVGFVAGETLEAGPLRIVPGGTSLGGFAVVLLSAVDGQELGGPGRYLITALGACRNPGMVWNAERNSVGTQWGEGPTLCEGVPLSVTVPGSAGTVELFGLNPDGTRRSAVSAAGGASGGGPYELGADQETLWYELVLTSPDGS
jgi:hypothetical protein